MNKYFSTFSGIGAPEVTLEKLGLECVGYSEIDKYAIQIYQKHFPKHKNYGDITKIKTEELPDFDILIGGFPCQAFSIAGKRRGFEDTRGTLFFELARILLSKQPRLFLFENVKGLLSHDNGQTFRTIIATLTELGYDTQWQVLNSKNFGIPQNRERMYIVGHLRGTSRPEVFPITGSNGIYLQEITKGVSDAQRIYDTKGVAKTLKGLGGGLGAKTGLYANTIDANYHKGWSPNGQQSQQRVYNIQGKVRRLTPIECERLQGFPDGWTEIGLIDHGKMANVNVFETVKISDTQRYKTLGNAMTVNVVGAIINKIHSHYERNQNSKYDM